MTIKEQQKRAEEFAADPIAFIERAHLKELQRCNGMSVWAENPSMYAPLDPYGVQAPANLVAVYTTPPAQQETVSIEEYRRVVARCIDLGEKLAAWAAVPAGDAQELAAKIRSTAEHWAYMAEIDNTDAAKDAKHKHSELVDRLATIAQQPQAAGGERFTHRADGRVIYDEDFEHDAHLTVSGDFVNGEARARYAAMLCARLNVTPPAQQAVNDQADSNGGKQT